MMLFMWSTFSGFMVILLMGDINQRNLNDEPVAGAWLMLVIFLAFAGLGIYRYIKLLKQG